MRTKRFLSGLVSSYLAIGVNVGFTIASVPLALHYLSREEFGIWALVTQISGYLMLLEFGMSGSVARFLADHKDDINGGVYGDILKTGSRVFLCQGGLVGLVGIAVAAFIPGLLEMPEQMHPLFVTLMGMQALLAGTKLAMNGLSSPLWSHQRLDISNLSNCISLVVQFAALWLGFHLGWKLYSLVIASAFGSLSGIAVGYVACKRLGFYPSPGHRGKFDAVLFRNLFGFGGGIFLMNLGTQLASASQVILVSRLLGLEAASVWAIATKVFSLAQQFVARILDASAGALAEMVVKEERNRLLLRFSHIVILSAVIAAVAAAGIALMNQPFVEIWTSGRIAWSPLNDLLLAGVLFTTAVTRCHTGLVGLTKQIRGMKYVYLLEGAVFVAAALALGNRWGFSGLLVASMLSNVTITGLYSMKRTASYFSIPFHETFKWVWRPARLLSVVAGLFLLLQLPAVAAMSAFWRLGSACLLLVAVFLPLLWHLGISVEIRRELVSSVRGLADGFRRVIR